MIHPRTTCHNYLPLHCQTYNILLFETKKIFSPPYLGCNAVLVRLREGQEAGRLSLPKGVRQSFQVHEERGHYGLTMAEEPGHPGQVLAPVVAEELPEEAAEDGVGVGAAQTQPQGFQRRRSARGATIRLTT